MKFRKISALVVGLGLSATSCVWAVSVNPIGNISPGVRVYLSATVTNPAVVTDLTWTITPNPGNLCPSGMNTWPPTLTRWIPGTSDGGFIIVPRCVGTYNVRVDEYVESVFRDTAVSSFHSVDTPPIADPGPDEVLPHVAGAFVTVTLDGSNSFDPDPIDVDHIVGYFWRIAGSPLNPDDPRLPTAEIWVETPILPQVDLFQGYNYTVELTVTDMFGVDSVPVSKLVTAVNAAPVIDSIDGPQAGFVGDRITLCALSHDPDGDPVFYTFEVHELPNQYDYSFSYDSDHGCMSFTAVDPGNYLVGFAVMDNLSRSLTRLVVFHASVPQVDHVDLANDNLQEALAAINALPDSAFKNRNMRQAFTNKLQEVLQLIDEGAYKEATDKLKNDLLGKMNAYVGGSSKNDWFLRISDQSVIGPMLQLAIEHLTHVII